MIQDPLAAAGEIDKIAKNLLIGAKAWGKFPTRVDDIIVYAELSLAKGIDLGRVEPGFFAAATGFLGPITRKILGMIDLRQKTIYLDESQKLARKNFVKLHEVGHGAMPWQKDLLGCKDDEATLDPEIQELYEREASYFASASLFQLERFDEEAAKLPLALRSGRALGNKFGGSVQAALRRYVERSPKRCAMLVFHKPESNGAFRAKIRNYFESPTFLEEFGRLTWPQECGLEYPFVKDMRSRRRDHQDGQIAVTTGAMELLTLQYHFFDSTYNVFVFFFPPGEKISSRTTIASRG
jgi:hypothetical protein